MPNKKLIKQFFIYTIVTFIIGITMKLTLIGWEADTMIGLNKLKGLDPNYNAHMIEAGSGLGTQVLLVIITLIAYPVGMIKMWKTLSKNEPWTTKTQKRLFIEYLVFLIAFVLIDLSGISMMIVEHAPMSNGWVQFALISILFPTGFAVGSLLYIRKTKSLVQTIA